MLDQSFIQKILPYVGGIENVSRQNISDNEIVFVLKDRNLVDTDKLKMIFSFTLNKNYLKIKNYNNMSEGMKMKKNTVNYDHLAGEIIEKVGGKTNIKSVRHCYTRLRFSLRDNNKADTKALEAMDDVLGVVSNSEEYMVVIGNHVAKVYNAVTSKTGLKEQGAVEENLDKDEKGKNVFSRILSLIMASMQPIVNLICACGIIKGLMTLLSMTDFIPAESGIYVLMNGMGDAIFFFLPIALGYNFAKNLKGNPFLGFLIGAILCYPSLNGVDLNFFGQTINATYTGTFLPVAFIVALAMPLERFFNKYIPSVLKGFLTPVLVLMITIPIGFTLIGPIANVLGEGINTGMTGLISFNPIIAGIVIGAFWQVLVLFGLHGVPSTFIFMNLAAGNPDQFLAMNIFITFAASGVVLGIYLRTKSPKLKSVALPAFISGMFGISEPAIYGVTLPRLKMFVVSCIAAALGSATVGLLGVTGYAFTGIGFFAALGMLNPANPQIWPVAVVIAVHFIAGFALSFMTYKDTGADLEDAIKAEEVTSQKAAPVTLESNTNS
ncbi:PTS transporter subunit EIIC [Enterococcus hulanensis]|uniref:PTS transporter subunit EIIC n=1 Tax=Enterococcus hulanensis TaxID=2559929 RepID=UPI001A8DD70C|nr:PTS transporter subunit EIIC [Enterococcus hulanensis]MBO0458145.1 PTS transporter subunit EIIC [Enterococcus hulanensis]